MRCVCGRPLTGSSSAQVLATLLVEMLAAYFLCIRTGDSAGTVESYYRYESECNSDCWTDGIIYFASTSARSGTTCLPGSYGDSLCWRMPGGWAKRTYRSANECIAAFHGVRID